MTTHPSDPARIEESDDFLAGNLVHQHLKQPECLQRCIAQALATARAEGAEWAAQLCERERVRNWDAKECARQIRDQGARTAAGTGCEHSWKTCHGSTYCTDCDAKSPAGTGGGK